MKAWRRGKGREIKGWERNTRDRTGEERERKGWEENKRKVKER